MIEQIDVLKALLRDTRDGLHNYSGDTDGGEDRNPMGAIDEVREAWGGVTLHGFSAQKDRVQAVMWLVSSSLTFSLTAAYLRKACRTHPIFHHC